MEVIAKMKSEHPDALRLVLSSLDLENESYQRMLKTLAK